MKVAASHASVRVPFLAFDWKMSQNLHYRTSRALRNPAAIRLRIVPNPSSAAGLANSWAVSFDQQGTSDPCLAVLQNMEAMFHFELFSRLTSKFCQGGTATLGALLVFATSGRGVGGALTLLRQTDWLGAPWIVSRLRKSRRLDFLGHCRMNPRQLLHCSICSLKPLAPNTASQQCVREALERTFCLEDFAASSQRRFSHIRAPCSPGRGEQWKKALTAEDQSLRECSVLAFWWKKCKL